MGHGYDLARVASDGGQVQAAKVDLQAELPDMVNITQQRTKHWNAA